MNRFLCLLPLLALTAYAQPSPTTPYSATLAWDRSPGTNVITNYSVFWGVAARSYTNHVDARTNLTATVTNLIRGPVYFFAATATDNNNLTSDYSNETATNLPAPPSPVANLRITAVGP